MKKAGFLVQLTGIALLASVLPAMGQIAGGIGPARHSLSRSSWGIGFGARSIGMGGAFIAIADDITAMSHNPAGLSQLLTPEFSLGCSYGGQSIRVPEAFYDWSFVGYSDTATITPYKVSFSNPSLDYAGGIVPFKLAKVPIVLGFAYQRKFIDTASFSYDWVLDEVIATGDRTVGSFTDYFDVRGGTYLYAFSLSARPLEFLHIGFNINSWHNKSEIHLGEIRTYDYYFNDVFQSTVKDNFKQDVYYRVTGGISYDAGILLKFKRLSAGFVYKSGFKADYTVNDGVITGVLNWPYGFGAGLAFRPAELLTLTADYTRTNWSEWRLERPDGEINNWGTLDSYQVRLGAEYALLTKTLTVPLRTGWFFDRSNEADEEGPIASNGLTFGSGLISNSYRIDIAAVYYFGKILDPNSTGYTKRIGWGVYASFSVRFGKG
jgi:long-chain fatty acid transport protein